MSTATQTKPHSSTLSSKGMLIGGQWVESASGARLTVENPAKRAPIAEVPRANAADVERAVAAGDQGLCRLAQGRAARARQGAAQDRRGHPGPQPRSWRAPSRSRPAMRCAPRRAARPT